jgi:hypothetical protein
MKIHTLKIKHPKTSVTTLTKFHNELQSQIAQDYPAARFIEHNEFTKPYSYLTLECNDSAFTFIMLKYNEHLEEL